MTDKAISPLRRRLIEDMTIRKLAPKTQASYIRAVTDFTIFLGRSPDQASAEDLRRYQLHLASSSISIPSHRQPIAALGDVELPEVIIEPPDRGLDEVVHGLERDRGRHLDLAAVHRIACL